MSFNCQRKDGENQDVTWEYINKAYLPAITVCSQNLYTYEPTSSVDDVEGFNISANGVIVTFQWNKNIKYSRYLGEIKIGENDWVNWMPEDNNGIIYLTSDENTHTFYMPLTFYGVEFASGDTIQARMRYLSDNQVSSHDATATCTLEKYLLFEGNEAIVLEDFENNYETLTNETIPNLELVGQNILIDRPDYIADISLGSFNFQGTFHLGQLVNCTEFYCDNKNITAIDYLNIPVVQPEVDWFPVFDNLYVQYCPNFMSFIAENMPYINYIGIYDCENFTELSVLGLAGNGGKAYVGLNNNNLDENTLNSFFNNLAIAYDDTKSYIDIGGNPGSDVANVGIAVDKGLTVFGGKTLLFISTDEELLDADLVSAFEGHYVGTDTIVLEAIGPYLYINNIDLLQSLDISNLSLSGKLRISTWTLTDLNVTNNALESIYIGWSTLTVLDVGGNTSLTKLTLDGTANANIANLNDCPFLSYLYAPYHGLDSSIDLTNFPVLTYLYAYQTDMDVLDFSGCPLIQHVDIYNATSLTSVNLTGCTQLTYISLGLGTMTSLTNLNDCTSLVYGYFNDTQLTGSALDVTDLPNLLYFNVSGSYLTSFDASSLPAIDHIDVASMPDLTSASFSEIAATQINAYNNSSMSTVTIDTCVNLSYVALQNGNMNSSTIDAILTALPDRTGTDQGTILVFGNPGAGSCTVSIGTNKNWFVGVS